MSKQIINIVGSPSLYIILEEIKQNLPFHLASFDKENDFFNNFEKNKIENKNSLIFIKTKNLDFFNKKKIFEKKNIFFLLEKTINISSDIKYNIIKYPFDIFFFIEKINIELIKQKYNYQSEIIINKYHLDLNSRLISHKDNFLKLTEKEIDIILFLNDKKEPQNISILQNKVWKYSSDLETHTVETHIYRLRKKISTTFKDSSFIVSTDEGYIIK